MKKITPFLWYNAKADEVAKFYCSVFKDSKIIRKNGNSVTFRIKDQELIAFNGGPLFKFTHAFSLSVPCKTQKEIDYYWGKLLKGGEKSRCGWLKDKYGLSWQIIPEILGDLLGSKDAVKANRAFQAMMKMDKIDIKALKKAYNEK